MASRDDREGTIAIVFPGVVSVALAALFGAGLADQDAAAGMPMRASLPGGATVSSVMDRARWAAQSSFGSRNKAPTRRTMASSSGRMPGATPVRRSARHAGIGGPILDHAGQEAITLGGADAHHGDLHLFEEAMEW